MVGNLARRSFSTLVAAAFADGELNESERQVLHRKATELSIPQRLMDDLLDQGQKGRLRVAIPANRHAREELMNDLIDVVCADGRLEAPEHHLLAKFGSHIGMALADLRGIVRERLRRPPIRPKVEARIEPEIRIIEEIPPEPKRAPEPPKLPEPPRRESLSKESEMGSKMEMLKPGPFRFEDAPSTSKIDVPPVTLGLLKQSILLETPSEAVRYAERLTGLTRPEAQDLIASVMRAHPDLKPGSMQVKART